MKDTAIETHKAIPQPNFPVFGIIEKILRNRKAYFVEIQQGIGLPAKIRAMLISSISFLALYGAVMGSTHSLWQTLSSAIKLPMLFMATLFICVPSLYFFGLLFGYRNFGPLVKLRADHILLSYHNPSIPVLQAVKCGHILHLRIVRDRISLPGDEGGVGRGIRGSFDPKMGAVLLDVRLCICRQPDGMDDPAVHRRTRFDV